LDTKNFEAADYYTELLPEFVAAFSGGGGQHQQKLHEESVPVCDHRSMGKAARRPNLVFGA
jgi:hypothetical protein